jgi:magnesium-transporting ATPase (P-type)
VQLRKIVKHGFIAALGDTRGFVQMFLLIAPWQIANALLQYAHYGTLPLLFGLDKTGMIELAWWVHLLCMILVVALFPLVMINTFARLHDNMTDAPKRRFGDLVRRYYGRVLWITGSSAVIMLPFIFFWYFVIGDLTKDPLSLGIVYSLYFSPLGIILLLTIALPAVVLASWASLAVVAVFDDDAGALRSAYRSLRYIFHNAGTFLVITLGTIVAVELIYYLAMELGRIVNFTLLVERIVLSVEVAALFLLFAGMQTALYHGRKRRVFARMERTLEGENGGD